MNQGNYVLFAGIRKKSIRYMLKRLEKLYRSGIADSFFIIQIIEYPSHCFFWQVYNVFSSLNFGKINAVVNRIAVRKTVDREYSK